MRSNYHARRRIKERLGGGSLEAIVRLIKQTLGHPTHYRPQVKRHVITYNARRLAAIYDWRNHRLVTVIPLDPEAHDRRV